MPILVSGILQQKHLDYGLELLELDDHLLTLVDLKGYPIAQFSQLGAMPVEIIRIADNYIDCAGEFKND